ncbi:Phytocyanin domain-containing protein [Heracleum sosnowskyi]|uniref:Phytocyanin domain-containing protein n=1 Tax=Heracleum sosnowskyi TaxID=360622 RepID=A0AAD8MWX4_9APIA|nr:Phytocyanin domain-containing protein [Heracleum sosnowskyi]
MAPKLQLISLLAILCVSSTCTASTYMVGDTSGWDVSTNLDSWTTDKQFNVGDVLVFLYSSTHSVWKVKKENYETCNTKNVEESSSKGNSSFTLTEPGDTYFICGNKLHCLGGMKIKVTAIGESTVQSPAESPVSAQAPRSGGGVSILPLPLSKNNKPSTVVPSSTATFYNVPICECLSIGLFGFLVSILT